MFAFCELPATAPLDEKISGFADNEEITRPGRAKNEIDASSERFEKLYSAHVLQSAVKDERKRKVEALKPTIERIAVGMISRIYIFNGYVLGVFEFILRGKRAESLRDSRIHVNRPEEDSCSPSIRSSC